MTLITAKDIAFLLRLSHRHVSERVVHTQGFPKPVWRGRPKKWEKAEVEKWLQKSK